MAHGLCTTYHFYNECLISLLNSSICFTFGIIIKKLLRNNFYLLIHLSNFSKVLNLLLIRI
jgi:hypothetical protein